MGPSQLPADISPQISSRECDTRAEKGGIKPAPTGRLEIKAKPKGAVPSLWDGAVDLLCGAEPFPAAPLLLMGKPRQGTGSPWAGGVLPSLLFLQDLPLGAAEAPEPPVPQRAAAPGAAGDGAESSQHGGHPVKPPSALHRWHPGCSAPRLPCSPTCRWFSFPRTNPSWMGCSSPSSSSPRGWGCPGWRWAPRAATLASGKAQHAPVWGTPGRSQQDTAQ